MHHGYGNILQLKQFNNQHNATENFIPVGEKSVLPPDHEALRQVLIDSLISSV